MSCPKCGNVYNWHPELNKCFACGHIPIEEQMDNHYQEIKEDGAEGFGDKLSDMADKVKDTAQEAAEDVKTGARGFAASLDTISNKVLYVGMHVALHAFWIGFSLWMVGLI